MLLFLYALRTLRSWENAAVYMAKSFQKSVSGTASFANIHHPGYVQNNMIGPHSRPGHITITFVLRLNLKTV
jgi:hypothetical protein